MTDKHYTQPAVAEAIVNPPSWHVDCSDAVEWLTSLPSEIIDCAITDYAYESLEKHRAVGTTTRLKHSDGSSNDWFPIFRNERVPFLMKTLHRVLKKNSHLYMFCDEETRDVLKPAGEAAGFRYWKAIVWNKMAIGMGYHYRNMHEFILFFEKGKRKLGDLGVGDVLNIKRVHNGYPTEKPVEVNEVLVKQSSSPGDLIIDPFCGSASCGEAALRQRRRFLGCDISDHAIRIANQRLDAFGRHDSELKRTLSLVTVAPRQPDLFSTLGGRE